MVQKKHSRTAAMKPEAISPEMDRHNGRVFFLSHLMIFLSVPAVYVGVVQAALCDELGANATLAALGMAARGLLAVATFKQSIPHVL